ncbi:hypothetical protein JG688_00015762 [Phytophthora aleatoria]|uniref:PiggyBac transposable element-derived protein 4 C-terminal zinc-ribbon domain-containing protein n=1 Tax=Phytophthora aleatoria TaxID=2496075 RepID=A0A8J5IJI2_9STRA|nr:hypothetical protein JG688_00015762 [Phytophthora aleatoria]
MDDMQVALLAVGPSDFEGDLSIEAMFGSVPRSHARHRSVTPGRHELEQVDNFRVARVGDKTQRTSRPYAYKVCSILRRAPNKPAWETTYLCRTCSNAHGSGVVYLCQRARQHDPTGPLNTATCSQIWHDMWRNGTDTPEGHWYRRRVPQNGLGSSRNADSEESEEEVQ